jgi:outer membrane receptor protein involved in Fe transport
MFYNELRGRGAASVCRCGCGLLVCGCAVFCSGHAAAQQSVNGANLAGIVFDAQHAAVPHAQVAATSESTGLTTRTASDAEGRFRFALLPSDDYRVTAETTGFAPSTYRIHLDPGGAYRIDMLLPVASATANTSVVAAAPMIETASSQIAETVSSEEARQLPFNGRNFLDLALLLPGVSQTNTASAQVFAETSAVLGQGYSVNSQRNFANSFVVDGLSANDDAAGLAGNVFGLDTVREFQVVTSGGQAEFGRASGGYFNVVTQSGTGALHGSVYGFLRNQRLNAANALSRSTLPLTQGQFGASLGGPVVRDRTFFFVNYEGRRLNTNGIVTINPVSATTINTRLRALGYGGPLLTVGTGATTLYPTTVHTDNGFARLDHRVSDRDAFTLRYSAYHLDATNARGVGGLSDVSNGTAVQDTNHTVAASNVFTASTRFTSETRGQFTVDDLAAPPNDATGPTVTVSGVATFGRFSSSPTARRNLLGEVVENVIVQHGAHAFKTGADFLFNSTTITFPMQSRGSYTFASLPAFLAGTYANQGYTQTFGNNTVNLHNPNLGIYLQDEWKPAQRLTLNLGVRYDIEGLPQVNADTNNISPRIGLAYAPRRDGGTVLQASFGLYYDRVPLRALANALLSANNTTDASQAVLQSYTYSPNDRAAPAFPAVAAAPPAGSLLSFTLMNRHLPISASVQASAAIEQAIGRGATLALSYQHVHGMHLIASFNRNINPDGSRPNPGFGNARQYEGAADSQYDGLAVSLVQRPAPWGSLRISYAWSKSLNDVSEFFFSSPVNNFNIAMDRALSDDDQRHRVSFDASLHSPMTGAHGFSGALTHGWQMSGILQYGSRLPFSVVSGLTSLQGTRLRPCIGGALTVACNQAQPGSMIARNTGRGFDAFNLNTRLSRTIAMGDRWSAEAMAEAFNVLNHRNDMIPNGTFGTGLYPSAPSASFGQATAVGDARSVQLALRLRF